MARDKGNGLRGFEGVVDVNSNINNGVNNNVKFNEVMDPLEKLESEIPAKELTTILKGIYFDNEVSDMIDEQAKRLGRGGKSKLVNEIVKGYFVKKGLL